MQTRDAEEDRWLRDYLDRRLTGAEAASFEAYAMTRARLLRKIELDTTLRDAVFLAYRTESSYRAGRSRGRVTHRRRRIMRHVSLSSSASAVLGLGTGFLCARSYRALDEPLVVPSFTRVMFDRTRCTCQSTRVEHFDMQSRYVLIEVALSPGARGAAKVGRFRAPSLVLSLDGYAGLLVQRTFLDGNRSASLKYDGDSVLLLLGLSSPRQAPK